MVPAAQLVLAWPAVAAPLGGYGKIQPKRHRGQEVSRSGLHPQGVWTPWLLVLGHLDTCFAKGSHSCRWACWPTAGPQADPPRPYPNCHRVGPQTPLPPKSTTLSTMVGSVESPDDGMHD
jgi:hypothetical protein